MSDLDLQSEIGIGAVFLAGGLATIIWSKRYARLIARRRERLYPQALRSALRIQERTAYYIVLGGLLAGLGLFFLVGALLGIGRGM